MAGCKHTSPVYEALDVVCSVFAAVLAVCAVLCSVFAGVFAVFAVVVVVFTAHSACKHSLLHTDKHSR